MFINEKVNHKKFGAGTVSDVIINGTDELKSLVTVRFESGESKKFILQAFSSNGFFSVENDDFVKFVDDIIKKQKEMKEIRKAEAEKIRIENLSTIPYWDIDEHKREVTIENWEKAWKDAENYRFPNESRAVVMDKGMVFINASAGCRYIETSSKQCNFIYKVCDGKDKKFMGHRWKYATKDEIEGVIERMRKEIDEA